MPLLTVGHGPDDRERLVARLRRAEVAVLVDVRRFPASRSNPDVRREALEQWLPAAGVGYRWDERLGGRRRLPEAGPAPDGCSPELIIGFVHGTRQDTPNHRARIR